MDNITELLFRDLLGKYKIRIQNPIRINEYSEPEPDIVVAIKRKEGYHKRHPLPKEVKLLIEVSDTTLEKDREVKLPIYAKAGIKEFWIVNVTEKQIEVYRKPKDQQYASKKIFKKGENIKCELIDFNFSVSDIF